MIAVVFCRAGLPIQEYADLPDDLIDMENDPFIAYAAPYIPTDLYYGIMWVKSDGLFHPNDNLCEDEADWDRLAELIQEVKISDNLSDKQGDLSTDEYGLSSVKLMSDYTVTFVSKYDGTITLYSYDGETMIELNSVAAVKDEPGTIEFPAFLQNSALLDIILDGSDFYIQLSSGSTVYRACKVS